MKKIDCHRHLGNEDDYKNLKSVCEKAEIEKIILFGHNVPHNKECDEETLKRYLENPDMIIPFACGFEYTNEDENYAMRCIEKGFKGFGELLLGHDGAKSKGFDNIDYFHEHAQTIYKVAAKYGVPVLVHCNKQYQKELLTAIEQYPDTTFIWAHITYDFSQGFVGELPPPSEIRKYLNQFNNLYFDTSFWKKSACCMNRQDYIELFEEYSTRFIFGLDLTQGYEMMQDEYLEEYLNVFKQLSTPTQENIFYNNIKNILAK